jgi:glycosyltransferase involved in cell wall biosynthesis
MKVLFVGKIDPWCSTPCGIRGYFRGLVKPYSKKGIDVTLIGTSSSPSRECPRGEDSVERRYKPLFLRQLLKFEFSKAPDGVLATESLGGGQARVLSPSREGLGLVSVKGSAYSNANLFRFVNVSHYEMVSRSQSLFIVALNVKSLVLKIRGFFSNFDVIHVQRIDQALPFIFFNKPVICTLHGKGSEQALEKNGKIVHIVYALVERFAISRLDHAIAVSEDIYNFYASKYPSSSNKMSVIGNGVDTAVFKPRGRQEVRKKYGFSPHEKIILYLGRFHEEKNLKMLVSSFDRLVKAGSLEPLRLVLVGEGNTKNQIMEMIRDKNLADKVTILPPVSDSEVPEVICCADVFALTSLVEGFPLVILQALACGIPIVSTNVGDVHKVVKNEETGLIVDDFSDESFARCLGRVIENANRYAANCVRLAHQNSWEEVSKKNIKVYNLVLNGKEDFNESLHS